MGFSIICGDSSSSSFPVLTPAQNDLSDCFQSLTIQLIPSLFMCIAFIIRYWKIVNLPKANWKLESPSYLLSMICCLMAILPLITIIHHLSTSKYYPYVFITAGFDSLAWVLSISLIYAEHVRIITHTVSTQTFWVMQLLVACKLIESSIMEISNDEGHKLEVGLVINCFRALFCLGLAYFIINPASYASAGALIFETKGRATSNVVNDQLDIASKTDNNNISGGSSRIGVWRKYSHLDQDDEQEYDEEISPTSYYTEQKNINSFNVPQQSYNEAFLARQISPQQSPIHNIINNNNIISRESIAENPNENDTIVIT